MSVVADLSSNDIDLIAVALAFAGVRKCDWINEASFAGDKYVKLLDRFVYLSNMANIPFLEGDGG